MNTRESTRRTAAAWLCILFLFAGCASRRMIEQTAVRLPKYEFRGAWIQTVFQSEYAAGTAAQTKELLNRRVEALHRAGCNAIIFQVRPESDAFYVSRLEPWSRFLTGRQGQAPDTPWDPLAYMVALCHERGMELHAWINPYRAATSTNLEMAPEHPYYRHPEWFITYDNRIFYDPAIPEVREYICRVARDIVTRYDIDALHLDDYFYPYPQAGLPFPDEESFNRYGIPAGYTVKSKGNWRRENVNTLICNLKSTLLQTKPWVRLGISPFGIYRNLKSWKFGSKTAGLQAYDDLYADVLLWARNGWIDYLVPQLYWAIGHKVADYNELTHWWHEHTPHTTHLYYGIDVVRTLREGTLARKLALNRRYAGGTVFWPAGSVIDNYMGAADSLRISAFRAPALVPPYESFYSGTPHKVAGLRAEWAPDGYYLRWKNECDPVDPVCPQFYIVYAFPPGHRPTVDDPGAIVYTGPNAFYRLPYQDGKTRYTYLVTAQDRFRHESKARRIKVKL